MLEKYMKFKKFLLMVIIVLALGILAVTGIQIYQERVKTENEYKELAIAAQEERKAQRELERQSNFYEKLEKGFDAKILVVGNSMGLSEGSSSSGAWTDVLAKKLEKKYGVDIWYKNISSAYTGYGTGYVKLSTLDDSKEYDVVITCYPATEDKEELVQYEAILRYVKQKYNNCAIISIIANSDRKVDCTKVYDLIQHYGGTSVNMQEIIDDHGNEVIDHQFYPNDQGYQLYVDNIFRAIESEISDGAQVENEIKKPVYDQVKEYDNCVFVPIKKCRKLDEKKFVIDLDSFSGKICIRAKYKKGNQAYDIYYDYGKWLTRNELNYSVNCWYESFLYHDVPEAEKELMFVLSWDSTMDEIEGVYLISENPITIKSN